MRSQQLDRNSTHPPAQSVVAQNNFEVRGDHAVIFVSQRNTRREVKIDAADLESVLAAGVWHAAQFNAKSDKWYCYTIKNRKNVYLHRFLASPPDGFIVDHRDGNGLDNRRSNIRVATQSLNQYNRPRTGMKVASGYRGVSLQDDGRYLALIYHKGKAIRLGMFDDPIIAALRVQWELLDRGMVVGKVHADNVIYEVTA
jgi:hypothetical protein